MNEKKRFQTHLGVHFFPTWTRMHRTVLSLGLVPDLASVGIHLHSVPHTCPCPWPLAVSTGDAAVCPDSPLIPVVFSYHVEQSKAMIMKLMGKLDKEVSYN